MRFKSIAFFLIIISFFGCDILKKEKTQSLQPKTESDKNVELISKKNIELKKPKNIILSVKGLNTEYDSIEILSENLYSVTDLKVINAKTSKVIDFFHEFHWGSVQILKKRDSFTVTGLMNESFTINYSTDESGALKKKTNCVFKNDKVEEKELKRLLKIASSDTPDWETVFYGIFGLATEGNKKAHDFFKSPTPTYKEYLSHSDGAASTGPIYSVLDFMKENGCKWSSTYRFSISFSNSKILLSLEEELLDFLFFTPLGSFSSI